MGQTLGTAAGWTSAATSGSRGKLEYNPKNQHILNKIIEFIEGFPSSNPQEAELHFKQPLKWRSGLTPLDFTGAGFETSDGSAESDKKSKDGSTFFYITNAGDISVSSIEYAAKVLTAAGSNKMTETRACLEANSDPVAKMLGDRFANVEGPDSSQYRYVEEILNNQPKTNENGETESAEEHAERMTTLKLLLTIQGFDNNLLKDAIKLVSKEVRINPEEVDRSVMLLNRFSGAEKDKYILEYIRWPDDYKHVFKNGCRAYPERQFAGDIAYIEIKPHDGDLFYVTANSNGFFKNQGRSDQVKGLNYDRDGEYYNDLISMLREVSPHFNDLIDTKEFFQLQQEEKEEKELTVVKGGSGNDDNDGVQKNEQQNKTSGGNKDKDGKKNTENRHLQPSKKWQDISILDDPEDSYSQPKKVQKKSVAKSSTAPAGGDAADDEDFEESSSESDDDEEQPDRQSDLSSDLPAEYWQIQKLVKYLKGGNQTATIIALCSMRDFNLGQETCQLAIRDVGGLEVLINLLETEELKCKIGSLIILKEISHHPQIRRNIADLGGLEIMVKTLANPNKTLKMLSAETIANVARFRRARRSVRHHGGIKKLVGLLDCNVPVNETKTKDQSLDVEVARAGASALWSCSKSTKNKLAMKKAGAIPLLAKLLKSHHENMLIPVVGTLQECANQESYRLAIRTEGMVEDLVNNLKSENQELQMHCASAIFKCAEEKATRDLVRKFGGLDPLVTLLNNVENKDLLAAATGAIWKCSISPENVTRFQQLKAIDMLVGLLVHQPEEVLVNVVGALAELAKDPPNRLTIRKAGGIPPLVQLLTGTNQELLINVTKAVGMCAEEPDNMSVIDKLDGVRLLWSLLKNQDLRVQASAAWALCPCIENAKDAGEMVRSFVGGLELIVQLLKTEPSDMPLTDEKKEVLASVCAAIANIANDEENLAVITDHGVVKMLADLTNTNDDKLRRHLSEAISQSCGWGVNRINFGEYKAVAPLVKYLKSSDPLVHRSTARALHQLSKAPGNCITMHKVGVVKPLMEMIGSKDNILQESAAGCIANIRRLALANEKARHK